MTDGLPNKKNDTIFLQLARTTTLGSLQTCRGRLLALGRCSQSGVGATYPGGFRTWPEVSICTQLPRQ